MSGFRVAWPLAAIHIAGRGDVVLRRGDTVPDGYDEGNIALLVTVGAVAPVTAAAEAAVVEDVPVSEVPTRAPAKSADKAAWVSWAVANGADPAEAEAAKKTELVATYAEASPVPSSLPDGNPAGNPDNTPGADDTGTDGGTPSLPA